MPKIYIEPGRSIVGEAGLTLYTVGAVKTIKDVRTYVAIDGGMADNPRYALYQAEYDIEIANKYKEPKSFIGTVAGKCCESGDLIQENAPMQTPEVGDVLAVLQPVLITTQWQATITVCAVLQQLWLTTASQGLLLSVKLMRT